MDRYSGDLVFKLQQKYFAILKKEFGTNTMQ